MIQTHRCLIKFVKSDGIAEHIGDLLQSMENSLNQKLHPDFGYDCAIWERQCCIDHDIYNHPIPINQQNLVSNVINIAFDGYSNIENFIDIFFNNAYWSEIENEFLQRGWIKDGPTITEL